MSRSISAVVLAVIVFASACGAGTTLTADPGTATPAAGPSVVASVEATPSPTLPPVPSGAVNSVTPVPAGEPPPVPSGAVNSVDGVRAAVVQINATGT